MKPKLLLLVCTALILSKSRAQSSAGHDSAKKLIEESVHAMGAEAWSKVKSLSLEGYGYENLIDESERPEGPFIPMQVSRSITEDIGGSRFLVRQSTQLYSFKNDINYLFDNEFRAFKIGSRIIPTLQGQELQDEMNLSPEQILTKALNAEDLVFLKDTLFQKAKHSLLHFKFRGFPIRIFLNNETNLLSAVEVTRPYDGEFAGIWGDSKMTVIYSFWMVLDKGIHYPLLRDTYLNGWYKSSFMVNKWEINPKITPDSLQISDQLREKAKLLPANSKDALQKQLDQGTKEIAPGIWFLPGPCNSTVIEQPDGLVVIEATHSSFYGDLIIKKARSLFPGKKIKALISTSDAWLHIGGIRSFAALPGIQIYHPARNRYIIEKLLHASYKTAPDALARTLKPSYRLTGITDSLQLGSGANRVVMYAYKTETGDRQMMVYFPGRKMLYTSDLFQVKDNQGIYWNPQVVWEVYHSIQSRKLIIDRFYAMHSSGLIAFKELQDDFNTKIE